MQRSCFCHWDYIRPGIVEVRSNAITAVTDAETLEPLDPQFFLTIDGLFDELQRAIDYPAFEIQAQFDKTFGYPTEFSIDYIEDVADDGMSYMARDLRIVPQPGDFDGDGRLTVADIDTLTTVILQVQEGCDECGEARFDLNQDEKVDIADHGTWVKDLKSAWYGDADLDGQFNTGDLVQVLEAGKYETLQPASWSEGDWNGDGTFGTGDLVKALADGGYEKTSQEEVQAVPEPSGILSVLLAAIGLGAVRRGSPSPGKGSGVVSDFASVSSGVRRWEGERREKRVENGE